MRISVIIPTFNEEDQIAGVISRIRGTSERNETEIIVADAASEDRTAELCHSRADLVLAVARKGRAFQMHQGAVASSGALLLFLHADTRLPNGWHAALTRAWSSSQKPEGTAFRLKFDSESPFYRFLARAANFRTRWTGVPHGDQAIAVDRRTYFEVGGFPPVPLMEEYLLFGKLARLGRVKIIPETVVTSTRRYENNGRVFNAIRNTVIIALFHLGISPGFLARLYRLHLPEVRRLSYGLLGPVLGIVFLRKLVHMSHPWATGPIYTADDYIILGDRLVHGFQTNMASWHLPLYVTLRGLTSSWTIQEAFFSACCAVSIQILLMTAGFQLAAGPGALLAGAGFLAMYSKYNFNFHDIQHFYCVLTLVAANLLMKRAKDPSCRASLFLALSLGVSLVCRSTMVFLPVFLVAVEWLTQRKLRGAFWKHALILLIVPYLFLLPWIWMNWRLHHQFIPLEYGQADGNIVPGALGVVGTPEGSWSALVAGPLAHHEVLGWAAREALSHPLIYLTGCAKRVLLVFSWGPLLFALGSFGFWRGRARREVVDTALLALYFLMMYCFMSIQPQYFKPLWLLLCLLGAYGLASWGSEPEKTAASIGSRLALGTIDLFLAAGLALAGYSLWLVGAYVDRAVPITAASVDAALRRHPRDPCLWYERGLLRLKEGDSAAGEDFRRAAALNPRESRYWLALAVVDGRWSGPAPVDPHDRGDMLFLRAQAELRQGRRTAARESLRGALEAYDSALYIHGLPRGRDAEILRPVVEARDTFLHGAYEVLLAAIQPDEALALLREFEKVSAGSPAVLQEEARLAGLVEQGGRRSYDGARRRPTGGDTRD